MIFIMVASHTLMAAMIAVMMAALSSGKIRDLESRLLEEQASHADIARRYNRIIASYGLAEPLIGLGGADAISLPSGGFVSGKTLDMSDVARGVLR